MTKFIIEIANTHGGEKAYMLDIIKEFEGFEGHGMKFQPLHPERLATADFEWYSVYQELYFNHEEWKEILELAYESKEVWLDLFDTYGVEILEQNLNLTQGIKLQASVLYNYEVLDALEKVDCSGLKLIVNISAIEIEDIAERILELEQKISPDEVLLEVGFQSY